MLIVNDNTKQSSNDIKQRKILLLLSIPITILLLIASFSGIFVPETYARNTLSYAAQGIGQDLVNFFIISPVFIISAILYYKNNRRAMFIWAGSLSYILYTYVIYGFAQPFNFLFLVYCAILGLSFYTFLYFLHTKINDPIKEWYKENAPIKPVIIYSLIIALLFYLVWLSEIILALLQNKIPESITENGLITNAVHVLDLALFLPALIISAVWLKRENKYGYLFSPILIIFTVFMGSAILCMIIAMELLGVATDIGMMVIFLTITALSVVISVLLLRSIKKS